MIDNEAIRGVIAEYALRLDTDDLDGCLALFTADAEYLVFGKTLDPERVRRMFQRAPKGIHLTGASSIAVDGSTATARTQVLFVESGNHTMRPALYDDEFVKVDGNWLFRRRQCQFLTPEGLADSPLDLAQ